MNRRRRSIGVLLMIALMICFGRPLQTMAEIQQLDTIELVSRLDRTPGALLINVLPKIIFDAKSIDGSINIPLGKLTQGDALPENNQTPLIFYCMGRL